MNKQILNLAIPNVISNITVPFVGLVDIALAGRMSSPAYVGGIGFGTMLFTFIYTGLAFLRMGTTGLTAQAYGASNYEESSNTLFRALILSVSLGLILIILQKPIEYIFISGLSGSGDALNYAVEYFKVRIWAAPATLSVFVFMGWFIGMQNSRIPMYITILISVTNILLSILFVLKFDMGIKGIALGTVLSQYTGLIASIVFYRFMFGNYFKYLNKNTIFNIQAIKKFFKVNSDIFIRSLLLTGSLFYFNAVSVELGDNILALNSIMLQFLWFFSYVADGFSYAGGTLTGKFIGAGAGESLKLVIKKTVKFGFYLSLIFTLVYIIAGKYIFMLLTDNISILELSQNYIHWIWILAMVSFMAFIYDGIYIGATATKAMRNIMLIVVLCLYLPLLHILKYFYGNHGMWLALCVLFLARGIGLWLYSGKAILNKNITTF
ncbi:MAG: MATE family efflux transporter [Bacteroidales bacterium]|nr:MATE family efflux transporter [Bacteroidales bacterium]